jgi:hypothetical protein
MGKPYDIKQHLRILGNAATKKIRRVNGLPALASGREKLTCLQALCASRFSARSSV